MKVRGAKNIIAREARTKNSRPRPLWVKPRPFLHDLARPLIVSRQKNDSGSSRVDLAATSMILTIKRSKLKKICTVTVQG